MKVIDTRMIVHDVLSETSFNGMTTCGQGYFKATLETLRTWRSSRFDAGAEPTPMTPIVEERHTSCMACIGTVSS